MRSSISTLEGASAIFEDEAIISWLRDATYVAISALRGINA